MNWKDKRVLVTGAGGFIGSHLAEHLVKEGAEVRAMVHYNALGRRGWLDYTPLVEEMDVFAGDIRDRDNVHEAMEKIDIVFHLAALIAIPYSYKAAESYVSTNVIGTLNVLQVARDRGIEKIVHTSTSEVYGTAREIPINESHPLQGQSPYSASKIAADKMVEAFHLSFGLPVTTIRPFNTFGPRQSARAIVPTIVSQCIKVKRIKIGNLHPTRDLSFVNDTVSGFILAAMTEKCVGATINLGTGNEISISDLVETIAGLVGKKIDIQIEENRIRPGGSEVERLLADNSLARSLLGWEPRISLHEGLRQTIEWIEQNLDMYRINEYAL
jgi:dTDP-glucose 4,6-dehydratase